MSLVAISEYLGAGAVFTDGTSDSGKVIVVRRVVGGGKKNSPGIERASLKNISAGDTLAEVYKPWKTQQS